MTEYEKGFQDGVKCNFYKLKLHPKEAIVYLFDKDKETLDELNNMMKCLSKLFPNYHIVAIPSTSTLKSYSKDVLENFISLIAEVAEEL